MRLVAKFIHDSRLRTIEQTLNTLATSELITQRVGKLLFDELFDDTTGRRTAVCLTHLAFVEPRAIVSAHTLAAMFGDDDDLDEASVTAALDALERLHFLALDKTSSTSSAHQYTFERGLHADLKHYVTTRRMTHDERKALLINCLNRTTTTTSARLDRDLLMHTLRVFSQVCSELTDDDENDERDALKISAAVRLVDECSAHSMYAEQADVLHQLLAVYQRTEPTSASEAIARTLQQLGTAYAHLKEHGTALRYLHRALAVFRRLYNQHGDGDDEDEDDHDRHVNIADVMDCIGLAYQQLGRDEEALDYFESAWQVYKRVSGESESDEVVINACHNVGASLVHLARYEQAAAHLNRSISTFVRTHARHHVSARLAEAFTLLGVAQQRLLRDEEALVCFQQALDIYAQVCNTTTNGVEQRDVAQAHRHMAATYSQMAEYNESIASLYAAVRCLNDSLEHADVVEKAHVLYEIGATCLNARRNAEALECFQSAVDIYRRVQRGGGHFLLEIHKSVQGMATANLNMRSYDEALKSLKQSADVLEKAVTAGHDEHIDACAVAVVYNQLGHVCEMMGKREVAITHYRHAMELLNAATSEHERELLRSLVASIQRCQSGNPLLNKLFSHFG